MRHSPTLCVIVELPNPSLNILCNHRTLSDAKSDANHLLVKAGPRACLRPSASSEIASDELGAAGDVTAASHIEINLVSNVVDSVCACGCVLACACAGLLMMILLLFLQKQNLEILSSDACDTPCGP